MPTVRCPYCRGKGRVVLSGVYAETLALLRSSRGEWTGAELSRHAGCQPTAMNNRLVALEQHGLATSRRHGRQRFYRAVPQRKS